MIQLNDDVLVFSFPEVHEAASVRVEFQRTLRIPDDDRSYPLPPGLGRFPLRHVDDHAARVSETWRRHGGVMLPMYQSEALWINFTSRSGYPFAFKVAAGKINAVTGAAWSDGLHGDPQDYVVVPDQPWLDGYCVAKGVIRQFVAMPLGAGYTAEEQLTGEAEHGGIQLIAYPMRKESYERIRRWQVGSSRGFMMDTFAAYDMPLQLAEADMGLAPGGQMQQEIYDDRHRFEDWDVRTSSRCFVHLANSLVWRSVTGEQPPTTPPTAAEYTRAGLPWFEYYAEDLTALEGAERLKGLKSVVEMGKNKGDVPLPENEAVDPKPVVTIHGSHRPGMVREGTF